MGKIEQVRAEMMQALKNKETARKETLSLLLSALKAKEKDKCAPLTEEEEVAVIKREIKQTKETLESAPKERADIVQECEQRLKVLAEFAPQEMSEEQVREILESVLAQLGLEAPTGKDKGAIMRTLMPLVKGKADGAMVNRLVGERLS